MSNGVMSKGHANNGDVVLELKGIRQSFPQADGVLEVIRNADLTLRRGEMVALIGPSGSGKSTLLHITGMLEKAVAGEIVIAGNAMKALGDDAKTAGKTSLSRR